MNPEVKDFILSKLDKDAPFDELRQRIKILLPEVCDENVDKAESEALISGMSNLEQGRIYHALNDKEKAKNFYQLSADQGEAVAQNNLAVLLKEDGDIESALKYYKLAADQGAIPAQLGYADTLNFENRDSEEAVKYYKLAMEQGSLYAMRSLREMMMHTYNWRKETIGADNTKELALLCAQKALDKSSDIREDGDLLVKVLRDLGKVDEAIDLVESFDEGWGFHKLRGELYYMKGDHETATQILEKVKPDAAIHELLRLMGAKSKWEPSATSRMLANLHLR